MPDHPYPALAMNRLQSELHRLYLSPCDEGWVRAMVLELYRPAQWQPLAAVWKAVQADLALPAPAIVVSGTDGFQLWFSLTQPVLVAQAQAFLESLRKRYLGDVAPAQVRLVCDPVKHIGSVPTQQEETGHWSAFVTQDLASIFADEPWLDRDPGSEGQADLLCRIQSIPPAAFELASSLLRPPVEPLSPPAAAPLANGVGAAHRRLDTMQVDQNLDPKQFLRSIMNDPAVDLHLRIDAAKALLPHTT